MSKVAFVTGGASGIGKGISVALAAAGFHVAVADLRDGSRRRRAKARWIGGPGELVVKPHEE